MGEPMSTKTALHHAGPRHLTKHEIDRRIDTLVEGLAFEAAEPIGGECSMPRFISAADLVERMRPFIVMN